ncbi:nucleotidyltransferase substrate binding protein [Clostridium thailandense]|uniref:nucleotidyltransferase substrate binding protein n=1 Tax=Clostridium thailandense TaxID=2794346 RepID=UPI003988B971
MLKDRIKERFKDYNNAFLRLKEATNLDNKNDIVIDAVIQRFEFTFELSWKLMKAYLEYEGIEETQSPRSTIKCAYKFGLIEDGDAWIDMMLDRNRTSHVYDEILAVQIYNNIKSHHKDLLENLLYKFQEIL